MSNQWDDITQIPSSEVIMKMPRGMLAVNGERKGMGTTRFPNTADRLADGNPYPGIWQPFLSKKKQSRVTVIDEKIFAAAVYTSDAAKDDWRRHRYGADVVFRHEEFPSDAKQKCLRLLQSWGLRYGAFDFIESPDGQIIFLEVNTNGQYGWIEDELGLPISKAIADELAAIAETT